MKCKINCEGFNVWIMISHYSGGNGLTVKWSRKIKTSSNSFILSPHSDRHQHEGTNVPPVFLRRISESAVSSLPARAIIIRSDTLSSHSPPDILSTGITTKLTSSLRYKEKHNKVNSFSYFFSIWTSTGKLKIIILFLEKYLDVNISIMLINTK